MILDKTVLPNQYLEKILGGAGFSAYGDDGSVVRRASRLRHRLSCFSGDCSPCGSHDQAVLPRMPWSRIPQFETVSHLPAPMNEPNVDLHYTATKVNITALLRPHRLIQSRPAA